MRYRPMQPSDLPGIFAIYDHEVLHGTSTFDTEPYDGIARQRWLTRHRAERYPVIVAEADDHTVAGWASLSPFSERRAYDRTAEVSVYIHEAHRRKGLARDLLGLLAAEAPSAGLGVLVARITSESAVSLHLHESLGFQRVGTLHRVGEKFGKLLDVVLLELLVE